MAKRKSDLPPNVQAAVDLGNSTEGAYVDRRAVPAPARDYVIEDDPILAIGDDRVHPSTPEERGEPIPPDAPTLDDVTQALDESQPRIELAKDADPIARLAAAMEKMAERQSGPSPMDPTLVALLSGMMETMKALVEQQVAGNKSSADALRKSQDPSNPFAPDISVFNPRGERDHPRPQLKCRMFLPWEAERESLTREEIELLNLLEPGEFYVQRNDESRIMVTVAGTTNPNTSRPDRILMNSETALNNDYHALMPPLRKWLRQILNQRPGTKMSASRVMTTEDEVDLITEHGVDFERILASK